MEITGKTCEMRCMGRSLRFCNQKSLDWTHIYEYAGNGSDMHDAGCGVFALVHAVEWMHGIRLDPEATADISVTVGGRGDDGTDRPAMLSGMMEKGYAAQWGFRYDGDGLLNDHELLWRHMQAGGAALCNLRPGHIVALLAAREREGRRELLAMDSVAESAHEKVRDAVRGVVPGSEIAYPIRNAAGDTVGYGESWALFWVDAALPKDFNLLHRIEPI